MGGCFRAIFDGLLVWVLVVVLGWWFERVG